MGKYLVFLIAWFGNKFIKHIKIPQGLQGCSVSKQSHLPWPYSCRIRKDCLLLSPRNTILGIYVAREILIALEPWTENPLSPNRAAGLAPLPSPVRHPFPLLAEQGPCLVGLWPARVRSCQQESSRILSDTSQLNKTQLGSCRLQWTTLIFIIFQALLRDAEWRDRIFICLVFLRCDDHIL